MKDDLMIEIQKSLIRKKHLFKRGIYRSSGFQLTIVKYQPIDKNIV